MITVTLKVKLDLPGVNSLKEKRRIIKSIMARLKNKFNISISEVEAQDSHRTAVIGAAIVSNDAAFGNSVLSKVVSHLELSRDAVLLDYTIETY